MVLENLAIHLLSILIKNMIAKLQMIIKKNVPLNSFCNPKQITELCNYLFGKSGDNITGSKFVIDAGETL